jgi:hypothetical protein
MKVITYSESEQIVGGTCLKAVGYTVAALIGMGSYVASEFISEESNVTLEKLIGSGLVGIGFAYSFYARM